MLPPRLLAPLAALALSVTMAAAADASSAHDRSAPLASTGYVLGGSPDRVVVRDAHALTTLGVDGVGLAADGGSVETPDAGMTRLLGTAHAHGLRAELLVSNYSNDLGDFDPAAGADLLRDPATVQAVAAQLAGFVAAEGWDGIQVDLESLAAPDAPGLTAFVQALQADMSPEKSVSIAVMASTQLPEYAARGYDLAALGQAVDTMTLMTYDQHGPGWSGPGPIGALPWQKHALRTLTTQVPVTKVDLGVAGYGYTWPEHGTGRTVTDQEARRAVTQDGARAVWHKGPGEWSSRLSDGTVMWWSDKRSYRLRVRLATASGAHGLSIWRLGSIDPLP